MDDLIKRQDAIDACFHGGVANNYDCAEEIEKLPSAQKWKRWKMTRAEAIQILSTRGSDGMPHGYTSGYTEALDMAIEALQEQKTGKWITKSDTNPYYTTWWYECSECGQKPLRDEYWQEVLSDYCPNCGTRMECEEE